VKAHRQGVGSLRLVRVRKIRSDIAAMVQGRHAPDKAQHTRTFGLGEDGVGGPTVFFLKQNGRVDCRYSWVGNARHTPVTPLRPREGGGQRGQSDEHSTKFVPHVIF
jgi:hypothetical protein